MTRSRPGAARTSGGRRAPRGRVVMPPVCRVGAPGPPPGARGSIIAGRTRQPRRARPVSEASTIPSPKVVVGVDGSGADRAALLWAAGSARAWDCPLQIVHATEYVGDVPTGLPGADETGLLQVLREQTGASRAATEAGELVRGEYPDLEVDVVETVGSPAASL